MAQDINVKLVFNHKEGVPAFLISEILIMVEQALRFSEEKMLAEIESEFKGELPVGAIDRVREQFKTQPQYTLAIESATNGSIILFGVMLGAAYWLLDKTLGTTVVAAWEESSLHKRIKSFLNKSTRRQADYAVADLDRMLVVKQFTNLMPEKDQPTSYADISEGKVHVEEGPPLTIVVSVVVDSRTAPRRSVMLNGGPGKEQEWRPQQGDQGLGTASSL